jgi:hypothetical protein
MTTAASSLNPLCLAPRSAAPLRSARTSLILAELARQRRWERRQRRQTRARRAAWLAVFDRRPFESIRVQAAPDLVWTGALPLVHALRPSW